MSICTFHFDFGTTVRISPCTAFRSVHDYGQGYSRLEPRLRSDRGPESCHHIGWSAEFSAFEGNPDFVLSLARGLKVIEAFEGHTEGQTVADIFSQHRPFSRRGSPISHHAALLDTFESSGRTYRPKTRVLNSDSLLSSKFVPAIVQPTLSTSRMLVHDSSSLGVLDGEQVVYIGRSDCETW